MFTFFGGGHVIFVFELDMNNELDMNQIKNKNTLVINFVSCIRTHATSQEQN